MKHLLLLIVCLLLAFPTLSQTTLKTEQRVQTLVNTKGDTLIQLSLADAKIVLTDLYDKQISDSIISVYEVRDSINASSINLLKKDVDKYKEKCGNFTIMLDNNIKLIVNKDTEIGVLNKTIKEQKKEIRKQKFLKIMGFTAAVVLPITVLILTTH